MGCANCGNVVGVAGTYRDQDDRHYDEQDGEAGDYEAHYVPKFFTLAPRRVDSPEARPETVVTELLASFQLFWCDALGCTNRIRSAVEKLLTEQKVPQTTGRIPAKGRRRFLPLHDRIERYSGKRADI